MTAAEALNRLCKWRTVLTGWHLGSQSSDTPGVPAMRDLQDFRLVVRAEVSALVTLLVETGVFSADEYETALALEAEILERKLQESFPGYRAIDGGIVITPDVAKETNRVKRFPP